MGDTCEATKCWGTAAPAALRPARSCTGLGTTHHPTGSSAPCAPGAGPHFTRDPASPPRSHQLASSEDTAPGAVTREPEHKSTRLHLHGLPAGAIGGCVSRGPSLQVEPVLCPRRLGAAPRKAGSTRFRTSPPQGAAQKQQRGAVAWRPSLRRRPARAPRASETAADSGAAAARGDLRGAVGGSRDGRACARGWPARDRSGGPEILAWHTPRGPLPPLRRVSCVPAVTASAGRWPSLGAEFPRRGSARRSTTPRRTRAGAQRRLCPEGSVRWQQEE